MSKPEKSLGELSNKDIVNSLIEDFQNDISMNVSQQDNDVLSDSKISDRNILGSSSSADSTPTKAYNPKIIDFENTLHQDVEDENSKNQNINNGTKVNSKSNNTTKNITTINQEKDPDESELEINEGDDEETIHERSDDEGMDDTSLSLEEVKKLEQTALVLKTEGNALFKQQLWTQSLDKYNEALRCCPKSCTITRAIFYANRAAVYEKMEKPDLAISSCTKALALNPSYLKVWTRRARLYRRSDNLDEALADYQKILELDPRDRDAIYACKELPQQINERNEKLKDEMLGKLKDLGNMILRPFGLSTNNFQMVQNPDSGGYSVNFKQPN